jgi:hypothetical protein
MSELDELAERVKEETRGYCYAEHHDMPLEALAVELGEQ